MSITITINTIIISATWKASIRQKKEQSLAQQKYYIASMPLPSETTQILDKIIDDVFNRYQIMKLSHINNLYITDEMQYSIINDIFTTVYSSISDDIIDKLSLLYKKEYIDDIIVQKIQMIVLNFTVEVNGNYKDSKK